MRSKSSVTTTSWKTKAEAEDAEGRVTAAHKRKSWGNTTKIKKQTQKPKKLRTSGFVLNHIQFMKYSRTLGLGLAETGTQTHWLCQRCLALADIHMIKKIITSSLFQVNSCRMGGTLLLGEAGVDGCGLPQLQSLLHTFQQAPATGRPGVYLTTGLNGP